MNLSITSILKSLISLKATVLCLFWLIVLIFFGTVYQHGYGLYQAQDKFFYSWFVWGFLPGGLLTMTYLTINLLASLMVHFALGWRMAGLVVIHVGLLLLFLGGAVIYWSSFESHLALVEGESWNLGQSTMDWELVVSDSIDTAREVCAIDTGGLEKGDVLDYPLPVPLTVTIDAYGEDIEVKWKGQEAYDSDPFEYITEEAQKNNPGGPMRDLKVVMQSAFPEADYGMFPADAIEDYREKPHKDVVIKKYKDERKQAMKDALDAKGMDPMGGIEYAYLALKNLLSLPNERFETVARVKNEYDKTIGLEARNNDPQRRFPGLIATVTADTNTARFAADGLFGQQANLHTPVTLGDTTYYFRLQKKRYELPFLARLDDFERTTLPNQSADKEYTSHLTINHPQREARDAWQEDISVTMNEPYRYGGYTVYQTSFDPGRDDFSTLTVKYTIGWRLPYVATIIVFIGLAIHFLQMLYYQTQREARKRERAAAVASSPSPNPEHPNPALAGDPS